MMASTHNAIGNNNQINIDIAKSLLIEMAEANTLYNSIGYEELQKKPKCYENSNQDAPCWYHEYEFASQWFGNYMITAIWLKSELNEKELKIINKYIIKMFNQMVTFMLRYIVVAFFHRFIHSDINKFCVYRIVFNVMCMFPFFSNLFWIYE